MTIERFEDLLAWKKARKVTAAVYAVTKVGTFAKDYGLLDQIRRASVSVGSNIAEGFERGNNREFLTFLGIAKGSMAEVRSQLYTAFDVGHLDQHQFNELLVECEDVSKLISGLIASLRKTTIAGTRYHKSH